MNYLCRTQAYLNSITSTINSLCGMVLNDELQNNVEAQYKIIVTLVELDQATTDFIDSSGLDSELPQAVSISRRKFMNINECLIKRLEKIQLQGYNFSELITTLKLENNALWEEVRLS